MTRILALDLGTTYFKACLFDATGQALAIARRPVEADEPLAGRREISAERLCRIIGDLVGDVAAKGKGLGDVAAVTFAAQTNSFLLLDGRDQPLSPIILWSDNRAMEEEKELSRLFDSLALRETTGTVLATVRCADRFDASLPSGVFQGPGYAADIVYQMVFGDCSANLLEAYRNSLPDRPNFDELDLAAAAVPPGAEGLRVDRRVKGPGGIPVFHGRNERHGRGYEVRAILEAVAAALAEQVDELCSGRKPAEIRSLGGAARSEFWRQVKSDALGCRVVATVCPEPTSLGAAMLAAAAVGLGDLPQIVSQWVRTREAQEKP